MKKLWILFCCTAFLFAQGSLREKLGTGSEALHVAGEMRAGFIKSDGFDGTYAIGGHFHLYTKRLHGVQAGVSLYGVSDLGLNGQNPDFFAERKNFVFPSLAYISYVYKDLELKGGRFSLQTPHADDDDIRMVPNFFEGAKITYSLPSLHFEAGYITKMAGWENGGKPQDFRSLNAVLGSNVDIDGFWYGGVGYEEEMYQAQVWGYAIQNVANVVYTEASIAKKIRNIDVHIALQLDIARSAGAKAAGSIHSQTAGALVEAGYDSLTLSAAWNKEYGKSASMFSFGGGPYFTSMEDLTIDALGSKSARSYTFGANYAYKKSEFGLMYGEFKDSQNFYAKESDVYALLSLPWQLTSEIVYAHIQENTNRDIFRVIVKRSF